MHEKVHMVLFAVALLQFSVEVRAQLPHGFLAPGEHGVGEDPAPVFGDEHQVNVKVVDDMTAGAYIGIWIPPR